MQGSSATAFKAASVFLVEVVATLGPSDWDRNGLGTWSIRELVAHANRAHTTLEDYFLRPQTPEPRDSGYFSEEAIAQRGRESLEALGNDPTTAVAECSDRLIQLVEGVAEDATVSGPAGKMTFAAYLPSRTAELTIHSLDLLSALGRTTPSAPKEALEESLVFTMTRAVSKDKGELLLRAISGRGQLPDPFSVY
jgi:uncharacterized protein (TIGR03083 family)